MINKPLPDEYPAFTGAYINMVPHNADMMELLEQLQTSTYNFFSNIDDDKAGYAYANDKWTIKQVLGHMADTERVFAYRALCFSRENITLPGFDQDVYVNNTTFNSRSIQSLAAEFRTVREASLYLFGSLSDEQLSNTGIASGSPVSVRALVYITAGHELHHLKILRERYL